MTRKKLSATQIGYLRWMSPPDGRHLLAQGPRLAMYNKLAKAGLATKVQFGFRRSALGEASLAEFDSNLRAPARGTLARAVAGEKIKPSDPAVTTLLQADLLGITFAGEIGLSKAGEQLVASWTADDSVDIEGPKP